MQMMLLIQNAQIITPDSKFLGACLIKDGEIKAIFEEPFPNLESDESVDLIDAKNRFLAPGLIDLQLNGAFGHDFTDNPDSIWTVASQLPQLGVTGFLPTIITAPLGKSRSAIDILQKGHGQSNFALPLGLHIEGPCLNPIKKGAHNPKYILSPSDLEPELVADWTARNGVRLVTLAPEIPGALQLIETLTAQGVIVSAGHSAATMAEARLGFAAGIRYVTHLFNAMPPLHHREPGLVGAALADDSITIGLIPDGVHVHPELVKLVWNVAGDRINGVTDAMGAMGMPAGDYLLGDYSVTVSESDAKLEDGTLAGSVILPINVVKNLHTFTRCDLVSAVRSMTAVPADLLGIGESKGRIKLGHDADLIIFDDSFNIEKTIIGGSIVYDRA